MKSVLSWSSGVGMSRPHFILRSKARCKTVSSSSFVHSCVLIKSRPRRSVFIVLYPFSVVSPDRPPARGGPRGGHFWSRPPPRPPARATRPGHPPGVALLYTAHQVIRV